MQVVTMMDKQNQREWMSALADGQLHGDACAQAVAQACDDADAQATWQLYHLVGDVLRSGELARPDTGGDFAACVLARLQREDAAAGVAQPARLVAIESVALPAGETGARPVFDAKKEAANTSVFRWKMVAGFASLAAVAAIGWNSASMLGSAPAGGQLAQAPVAGQPSLVAVAVPQLAAQAANGAAPVMLRDPRLDEFLAAHKQLGGNSALQMPAGFLRNATFDGNTR